ncbi:MAG: cell division protein ZapD [Pseudomonadota bacterium]
MIRAASGSEATAGSSQRAEFEQPLTERLRTFLRLEFLYKQVCFHMDSDADYSSRAAIATLLDIKAILMRGDVRADVLKELERQSQQLGQYRGQAGVDQGRLNRILEQLSRSQRALHDTGPHFLQLLKESEFLSAIKHRSAIPGGTCEFDLPEYSFWLRQPFTTRQRDLERWLSDLKPLLDAVSEMLWLSRESAPALDCIAKQGIYQYNVSRDTPCQLLRVSLLPEQRVYPEISGSQHRFTIRFMESGASADRRAQTNEDVPFKLFVC